MVSKQQPDHYVVDGSNIATEGRSLPSLEQLNEAVLAFMQQYPKATITVVVDATFGHRIDKKERKAFDEAIANNELVAPPAGAVGRGDAFVLTIANQSSAGVLSNDSFQEFHGDYGWLFDDGRLIGGKPVPNVGWVFVARTPVRGPKSRQSIKESRGGKGGDHQADKKKAASRVRRKGDDTSQSDSKASDADTSRSKSAKASKPAAERDSTAAAKDSSNDRRPSRPTSSDDYVNDLMSFLDFVEKCPTGTRISATIDSYSSHGAYANAGDLSIYLPLRNMADPPPRSARRAVNLGDSMELIIVGFTPDRRSIDAALPDVAEAVLADADVGQITISDTAVDVAELLGAEAPKKTKKKTTAKKTTAKKTTAKKTTAKKTTAKKTTAKKTTATAKAAETPAESAESKPVRKRSAGKQAAKKTSAAAAKSAEAAASATHDQADTKAPAKKSAAKQAPRKQTTAKQAAAKQAPGNQTTAKKSAAKQAPRKQSAAKQTASTPTAAKKATARKATEAAAKQAPASATKQAPAKRSAAKQSTANNATAQRAATKRTAPTAGGERPNMRVHQLAKELDRPSAEVVDIGQQLGLKVTSHSSSLTADHADLIRKAFG